MNPVWYVDFPNVSAPYNGPAELYALGGWIACSKGSTISNLRHADDALADELQLHTEPRPDVEEVFLGMRALGVRAQCPFDLVSNRSHIDLLFSVSGEEYRMCFPTKRGAVGSFNNKSEKLSRLIPLLVCPQCAGGGLEAEFSRLTCLNCRAEFNLSKKLIDLSRSQLSTRLSARLGMKVSPQSANDYDSIALDIIHEYQDGLVLDYGSGVRQRYFDNVINYEISPNNSVDLLGDGGRLPLADNSVDAVLSLAVLEHVPNPFETAAELLRVLKPNGRLYVQVPFLFHEHGFPNHYYNMTQAGLKNLFGDKLSSTDIGVLDYGQPICMLTHFINEYVQGLPKPIAKRFMKKRIEDFLTPYQAHLFEEYVTEINDETKRRLASVNYLIGRKK